MSGNTQLIAELYVLIEQYEERIEEYKTTIKQLKQQGRSMDPRDIRIKEQRVIREQRMRIADLMKENDRLKEENEILRNMMTSNGFSISFLDNLNQFK